MSYIQEELEAIKVMADRDNLKTLSSLVVDALLGFAHWQWFETDDAYKTFAAAEDRVYEWIAMNEAQ